jgi:glycosyltransferase involved in cell wall biosynthesis
VSLQKTIAFERELTGSFDAAAIPSNESYAPLKPILSHSRRVYVIGNGVDVSYYTFQGQEPEPDTLIYHGALTFGANYDAVKWFLQEIFPRIRAKRPAATLKVTGGLDGVDLGALPNREGVTFTGYVPDIRSEVARSWVCVAPTRRGGGQRLKILEAMALGVPVVSTTTGAAGLEIVHEEHAMLADEPGEFAQAVNQLLEEEPHRDRLARRARSLMEAKYDWKKVLAPFQAALEDLT